MCRTVWRILFIICAVTITDTTTQSCRENGTIVAMKTPIYRFSVRFLDRISYGISDHFVYSPLATWLQLVSLADGAQRNTRNEIWSVTGLRGYRKKACYRRKLKEILNKMEEDTEIPIKRRSVVLVDKLFKVKKLFQRKVEALHDAEVLPLNFDDEDNAASKANYALNPGVDGYPASLAVISPGDFTQNILITADHTYFKSAWKQPFNKAQTTPAPFYSGSRIIATVDMMNQVGYFKEALIPMIGARVLELPFADERTSMLVYLPTNDSISDIYYLLKDTTLTGVLNLLKIEEPKAVNVFLPKFTIETEIPNIPELLYDMGVKRVFYPELAELKGITDSGAINVSSMKQVSFVDVTESHVAAGNVVAESIISDAAIDFNANEPFAFMLVDTKTEIILFAGMYTDPTKNKVLNSI